MDLQGKVAIVTGAARRLGRTIALALAEQGCHIALHYNRSAQQARHTAEEIARYQVGVATVQGELADPHVPQRIVEHAVRQLGRVDILVNNAAVFLPDGVDSLGDQTWELTLQVILTAPARLARAVWPYFRQAGAGKIVNIVDISADRPWPGYLAYCVSKAGLVCLTKALARAMAPYVQVNAVAPGVALFSEQEADQLRRRLLERIPLARPGSPDDVAQAVVYLLRHGDYLTGVVLPVDGGRQLV